jgi:proteasome lid subunit RPN8/RPN11
MNTTWNFPRQLLPLSVEAMRPYGAQGHEGLCLWFGNEEAGVVSITHLVVPHGPGLVTHPLHLSLSMRAMSRITRLGTEIDCYLAGQIHSHPGLMLELSDVDRRMGIHVQDYLSLVCPYYAQRDVQNVLQCGVHVFDSGRYRSLSSGEMDSRITVSDRPLEIVTLEVFQ